MHSNGMSASRSLPDIDYCSDWTAAQHLLNSRFLSELSPAPVRRYITFAKPKQTVRAVDSLDEVEFFSSSAFDVTVGPGFSGT